MRTPYFLLALIFLCAEIAGFILVGQAVGVFPTLMLVLLGIIGGLALLRRHGIATMRHVKAELAARQAPARALIDGAVLAVAALLLVLPGFLSDIVGLLLFLPPVRRQIWRRAAERAEVKMRQPAAGRPAPGATVELQPGEYASIPSAHSPWRRDPGHHG